MNRAHAPLGAPFDEPDGPGDPVNRGDPDGDDHTFHQAWGDYLQAVGLSAYEIAEELGEDPEELEEGDTWDGRSN
jgi:hypothetical protein